MELQQVKTNKKMTSCKVCQKEVAKSAIQCPHCGAKLHMHPVIGCLLWFIIIGLGIVIIAILVAFFSLWSQMSK